MTLDCSTLPSPLHHSFADTWNTVPINCTLHNADKNLAFESAVLSTKSLAKMQLATALRCTTTSLCRRTRRHNRICLRELHSSYSLQATLSGIRNAQAPSQCCCRAAKPWDMAGRVRRRHCYEKPWRQTTGQGPSSQFSNSF